MPELTVSMPAYNAGKYIREAIESVLRQDGIEFELIVVDDGSQDNTSEVVLSFKDPRIKLIRNKRNMGIAYCHNLVIEQSNSPFITHVDSDDLVLPDAFKKMVSKLKSDPSIGQVHCYFFEIDEDGRVTRDAFHKRRKNLLKKRGPDMDYKRELLVHGSVMNPLRTYRKEVFYVVGKFNEKLKFGEDYDIALRIVDKYDITLVPEFLYCFRIHKSNTAQSLRFKNLRFLIQRLFILRKLLKSDKIHFTKEKKYNVNRFMFTGLYYALKLPNIIYFLESVRRRILSFIYWRVWSPTTNSLYNLMVDLFPWWPINLFSLKKVNNLTVEKRIAYYLWHYPILSQTFIQREVAALKQSGLSIEVVADASGDLECLDENTRSLVKDTYYLYPVNKKHLLRYFKYFFFKNPLSFPNLFLYVVFHKYGRYKTLKEDAIIFLKAVYLAGVLKDLHINHVHSPWADVNAFIALIASKLLGVPYTVQARAHDVHRKTYSYALSEKFVNAEFIVTNTQYNESYLRSFLDKRDWGKIHTIYNGINLQQFESKLKRENTSNQTRILTVGRLIEQKGLVYLLKACKILKDRGYSFKCEIIGGPEEPLYINYYISLTKLYRQLGLEEWVFFLGPQPFNKVLEEYRNSDIFVLPCVIAEDGSRDITPNVLIEAMAMKLPVITTNVTGIPEIVQDGVSGILVTPNDENALAEAMIKLIEDHKLREKLGENARKKVEERFVISRNILRYVDLFKGVS